MHSEGMPERWFVVNTSANSLTPQPGGIPHKSLPAVDDGPVRLRVMDVLEGKKTSRFINPQGWQTVARGRSAAETPGSKPGAAHPEGMPDHP